MTLCYSLPIPTGKLNGTDWFALYPRYHSMRDLRKEVFKAIYLNRRNEIIEIIDLFQGTLEGIPIAPREIVENALRLGASTMIFAHNHPSGDPKPSKTDKQLTRDLVFIGDNEHFSFAEAGLMEKYENDYLNLKIKAAFGGGGVLGV